MKFKKKKNVKFQTVVVGTKFKIEMMMMMMMIEQFAASTKQKTSYISLDIFFIELIKSYHHPGNQVTLNYY